MHSVPWIQPVVAFFGGFGRRLRFHTRGDPELDDSPSAREARHAAREAMVELIVARGIHDERVLAALRAVDRREFVPLAVRDEAYADRALPLGHGQTISQPYIVALMTQSLELTPQSRVLEIGTGSAYQTAILRKLALHVTTIEAEPTLALEARAMLARLGYDDVECRTGDGHIGAADRAPFDAILVTAAPREVPRALIDQLAVGGRMCIPVGDSASRQRLMRIVKLADGTVASEALGAVRFVPMTGGATIDG
jgi:protein-L-isoaspartate(D-aspartate) O-methyltransferase